ncbi:DNA-invertase hin [Variibacter gotjawalensis]|uniref:DNA-invertase hin n=1 Tax=Variibacter gotjawalensis TaxID=1333996 RepID=A0A0S3PNQ7_9BRAD|nr:recombinase family protein [Variibacter gotjawalensis]NIK47894.1 DNA invertase Pin-like site-specific DNA recombinase [Variibacter gotjawalensis]RZS49774.1 DNA invertase Pin-like site-specific DNA recombinase [Variibacter gotjawalensis]BAT57602.1 DNA-invertase hin [Variibacter gotjawalensis]
MRIGYARSSLAETNFELQQQLLTKAGCEKIFVDRCYSRDVQRPGFEQAVVSARAGDVIVVWKLDRLAMSITHCVELLAFFRGRQVGLETLIGCIDTAGADAALIQRIFSDLAELDRDLLADRSTSEVVAWRTKRSRIQRADKRLLRKEQIFAAIEMLIEKKLRLNQVAAQLGVSRATLARYVDAKGNTLTAAKKLLAVR